MASLTETIKGFFKPEKTVELSSEVPQEMTLSNLTAEEDVYPMTMGFFDNDGSIYSSNKNISRIEKQKSRIMTYRQIARQPEVDDGIDEIVNEIIYSFDIDQDPLKCSVEEENEKISEAIENEFESIKSMINAKYNLFNLVRQGYIDGQVNLHCPYSKNVKEGIQEIKMIEPCYLYFDTKDNVYKYFKKSEMGNYFTENDPSMQYSREELIHVDFGLYDDGLILSYLDKSIKTANQLRTLEDLLIPLRFSRSISRRVFNVDVADLPNAKAAQAMAEVMQKFKYSKYYNVETGEVTNQQHITSMVEDYWFANRSGGRGTTVDTLDETGNLGELDDILYFYKKLYRSLKIPSNRISIIEPSDYDYSETRVTKEDVKFFMFISRLRGVYANIIKEILKRQLISKGILKETEWGKYKNKIKIYFNAENHFIDKMKTESFAAKIESFNNSKEAMGTVFSASKMIETIFKMSPEEFEEELKKIKKEEANVLYSKLYPQEPEF